MQRKSLMVFCKNPVLGTVKTRIAASVGSTVALHIYNQLLSRNEALLAEIPIDVDIYIYYSDFIPKSSFQGRKTISKLQSGADLGRRMANGFKDLCEKYDLTMIIGVDCPYITAAHIDQAFDFLASHDVVMGPAADGGYYLLGMKSFHPSLFEGIKWGSEGVAEATRTHIRDLGISIHELEVLSDIDYLEDWNQYQNHLSTPQFR